MASWKQSLKVAYKNSCSYVTLPDAPVKDAEDQNEGAGFGGAKNKAGIPVNQSPEEQNILHLSGAVPKTVKNLRHHDRSRPIELNCRLKLKKATPLSSDEVEEEEFEILPCFSLLEYSKNYDGQQQQCFNKDMLCTVVKDMELSSKNGESNFPAGSFESIENILQDVSEANREEKCIGILDFAKKCLSPEFYCQLDDADILSLMLKTLPDILPFNDCIFCFTVLLCILSQYPKDKESTRLMESVLIKLLQNTAGRRKSDAFCTSSNNIGGYDIRSLPENVMDKSVELCKLMSVCSDWELQGINMMYLNCISVQNVFAHSSKGRQRSNPDILCCIMDRIHEGVQQLSLKKQVCFTELIDYHSNLRVIWKCLQVLEKASFLHPENQKYLVSYQNSSISRNSNRMLGFCMKYLFYDALPQPLEGQMPESDVNYNKEVLYYLRSCLVSILKVLLYISHNCKEAVLKLGAIDGLMEKLLMCILSIGSQKSESEEQFEVLILCLELLINLIEPCWANHKTFAILCLKKFAGSADSKMFSVELLIEILTESLKAIRILEQLKVDATKNGGSSSTSTDEAAKNADNANAETVLKAARKHMEQSMICAYISILLGFFANVKKTFRDFVHDKMSREIVEQAVVVSKEFLNFVVGMTEGTNQSSIKLLNVMLSTLESIYDEY